MILKPKWLTKIEAGHQMSKGLVSSWIFNEGGGNLVGDTSGNDNHGTFVGDPSWMPGKDGPALYFDGTDDWVDCGFIKGMEGASGLSIVFWYKANSDTPSGRMFFCEQSGVGVDFIEFVWTTLQNIEFKVWTSGGSVFSRLTDGITDTEWHQVIGVYDGVNVVAYVDCVAGSVVALTGTLLTGATEGFAIGLGTTSTGVGIDLLGTIGSFMIYNRALNVSERLSLFLDSYQMFKRGG